MKYINETSLKLEVTGGLIANVDFSVDNFEIKFEQLDIYVDNIKITLIDFIL